MVTLLMRRSVRYRFIIFTFLLVFIPVAMIHASADPEFTNINTLVSVPYDESTASTSVQTIQVYNFNLRNSTNIRIMFSKGSSPVFDPRTVRDSSPVQNTLNYQLYDNLTQRVILKDLTDGPITSGYISSTIPTGVNTYSYNYSLEIPSAQFKRAGTYSDSFIMKLYKVGTNNTLTLVDSVSITVVAEVASVIQLAIGPTGFFFNPSTTQYTLDFGSFELFETLTCDSIVRANVPYSIQVSSLRSGVMRLTDHPSDPSFIGYDLFFNGSPTAVDLSSSAQLTSTTSMTTSAGQRFPLSVRITELDWPAAGTYSDSLTLTLSSN